MADWTWQSDFNISTGRRIISTPAEIPDPLTKISGIIPDGDQFRESQSYQAESLGKGSRVATTRTEWSEKL